MTNFFFVVFISSASLVYGIFLQPDFLPQYHRYGKSLVLVGGNLNDSNSEVYNTIVELAGGRGVAKIGIITAANTDPIGSYQYYRDLFLHYGALEANRIAVDLQHISGNSDLSILQLIHQQTGFFFGGGDQERIIDSFVHAGGVSSPALIALKTRFAAGAVIAGTSAGTACQPSAVMIRGGISWNALRYGSHSNVSDDNYNELSYNKNGGLGFIDGFIIDTHFSQRGREGRLIRFISDARDMTKGADKGFGVDENTALVITHAGTDQVSGKVIGENGVVFFDLSLASRNKNSTYFSIKDVYVHFLTTGDNIGLKHLNITFSLTKTPMKNHEYYDHALTSDDIFYGKHQGSYKKPEFTRVATSIYDASLDRSSYGDSYRQNPTFRVTMSRTGRYSEGWVERKTSFHSDIVSYKNMYVEIQAQ